VLNLLLYRLRGAEYCEEVLHFLRVDEMLVDIGDDLVDYEVRGRGVRSGLVLGYSTMPSLLACLNLVPPIPPCPLVCVRCLA
jgi:hypothetical protein